MIDRRQSIAAVAVAVLLAAPPVVAQPKAARIAVLGSGHAQSSQILLDGLVQGLRDNGLIPGRDVVLDVRWAEGHYERFTAQTAELLALQPKLLMVTTITAARAAQAATKSVPIVLISINDPVGAGLVATLARPGGNTTGIANMAEDLTPKVVEMLRALLPRAKGLTVLLNRANASNVALFERTRTVCLAAGLSVQAFDFAGAGQLDALEASLARRHPDALLVLPDSSLLDQREPISALALRQRVPLVTQFPEYTRAGALLGYGPPRVQLWHRSAYYAKKILDGAKPADLPVEQPTRVELSVNLKTAKALGITIPQALLLRADEVIE